MRLASVSRIGGLTAYGIDVVTGEAKSPVPIVIDQSITVHSSSNVIIGNQNLQGVSIDIEKLNAAIDGSKADISEKAEARSLLKKLMGNKLVRSILEAWIKSKMGR
jgi:hypothetical protein